MKPQEYFTSTKEQFKDSNWKSDITIGLYDASVETIPAIKGGVVVGKTVFNATKTVSPIIIQNGKNIVNKVDMVYDDFGRKVNFYHKQTPVLRKFGPDEINDILNESMPASTNIGQLYGTGVGIGTKLYQFYFESTNENKSNE